VGLGRTALTFCVGALLAFFFFWGLYYVIARAVGFEAGLTIELLAVTAIALAVMEMDARRRRKTG
jgi:hypothetical protein